MLDSRLDQASGSLGPGGNKKWEEERGNWLTGFWPTFSSRANSFSTQIGVCSQMKKWNLHFTGICQLGWSWTGKQSSRSSKAKRKIELKGTPVSASGSSAFDFALSYCRTGLSHVTIFFKSNFPSLRSNISSNHNILSPFLIKDGAFGRTDRFSSSFVWWKTLKTFRSPADGFFPHLNEMHTKQAGVFVWMLSAAAVQFALRKHASLCCRLEYYGTLGWG